MRETVLKWADTALSAPSGEAITGPDDLPDDLDELLALSNGLTNLVSAAYRLRREVEAKAAGILGPGRWHEYGDARVRWGHSYTWKADKEAVGQFIRTAAAVDPELVVDLFNPNDIRKTGVERVASALGVEPETAIQTLLHKKWSDEPGLQWDTREH